MAGKSKENAMKKLYNFKWFAISDKNYTDDELLARGYHWHTGTLETGAIYSKQIKNSVIYLRCNLV